MTPMRLTARTVAIVSLVALGACSDSSTAPTRASVSGAYVLTSATSFGGPTDASLVLGLDGSAERHARYPSGGGSISEDLLGTYTITGNGIELAFNEPSSVWRVPATFDNGRLTLTYPNPADGTIIEHYEKLNQVAY